MRRVPALLAFAFLSVPLPALADDVRAPPEDVVTTADDGAAGVTTVDDTADAPAPATTLTATEPTPTLAVEPAVGHTYDAEGISLSSGQMMGSARSNSSNWLILPRGWEATGELRLLTADAMPLAGGPAQPMRLTDVAITRAAVRRSLAGKAEITGGIDLLPKQTSYTDELVWQGADVGARFGIRQHYAEWVDLAVGPMTADQGYWASASTGVQRRARVHQTLSFQTALGGSVTPLRFDGGAEMAWLAEVVARGQALFMAQDMFGLWLSADFGFPVAHGGELPGGAFDPTSRVDVAIGCVYSVVDDWDVYAELSVVDRGDAGAPATQLPILQGGFDQRVLSVGITRHYGQGDHGYGGDLNLAY
ncbi:MAG: hypothetical protein KC464_19045 [Myxococcales bacterium]|nr:hypothetical protein [Myxococcales bacterium]